MIINTNSIKNSILLQTGKNEKKIKVEDLENVKFIIIDQLTADNMYTKIDINEIKQFPNLTSIELKNMEITKEIVNIILNIESIKSVEFIKCEFIDFLDYDKIQNIEQIKICNCKYFDYNIIKKFSNIKSIDIIGESFEDIYFIKDINLEVLDISQCNLKNIYSLKKISVKHLVISHEMYLIDRNMFDKFKGRVDVMERNNMYIDIVTGDTDDGN